MEDIRILHQYEENNTNYIIAESTTEGSCCPNCGILSKIKHSKYTRKIFNGTIEGSAQEITIIVRKFKCKTEDCEQKIFTERLTFTKAYARFTNNVIELIKLLALSASAERVSIILSKLGISISHDTILRFLRKLPQDITKVDKSVVNLGDDFAFKKNKKYCTLICDMDKKVILDILPSRNKDVVSAWLKKYPHIKLVSRDGSISYAGAISEGLPEAEQVSDKFHLIKNLLDSASKYIRRKYPRKLIVLDNKEATSENPNLGQAVKNKKDILREEKISAKWKLMNEIKEKHNSGVSIRELSKEYSMSRNTIKVYLYAEKAIYWPYGMKIGSELDKYKDLITELLAEGKTHQLILDEISKHGYTGSRSSLSTYMSKNGIKRSSSNKSRKSKAKLAPSCTIDLSFIIKLICKNQSNLMDKDLKRLEKLEIAYPELLELKKLIDDFKNIFKENSLSIEEWITNAKEFEIPEINSFVTGIEKDLLAVKNSVTSQYTNGLLEGMVNKVKGIKRTSYGRCKFDLLRTKVLNSQVITG